MRKLLFLLGLILIAVPVLSTQLYVVGEVFTQTWCGFCPAARSALRQMYENEEEYPYLIPIIWQGNGPYTSPNYSSRGSLYGVGGIPHAQFGGYLSVVGGGAGVINNYIQRYNQLVPNPSPIVMESHLNFGATGGLELVVDIELIGNINTTDNKLIFLLTYNLDEEQPGDYFASVTNYHQQDFTLTQMGQTGVYSHEFTWNEDFDFLNYKAVAMIQTFSGNKAIHQATMTGFTGLTPLFSSNVQSGPPNLAVQFTSFSLPANEIVSWEWDLTGDGEIDSIEENPFYIYSELGTYNVSLTVSDGVDSETNTMENFITVTESTDVMGNISGYWSTEFSPYIVTGDITIAAEAILDIEPGVEIFFEADAQIEIRGLFNAVGTEEDPVLFHSESGWKGLRFINNENDNIIAYCYISDANRTAIHLDNSRLVLKNNRIFDNHTTVNQPSSLGLISSDDITVKNNVFTNNSSTSGAGVIELTGSTANVENNLLVNNQGAFASVVSVKSNSEIHLVNNTIYNNVFTSQTGCHIFGHNSMAFVRNSIVRGEGNIFNSFMGGSVLVFYSNVSNITSGLENIDEDPMFISPTEGPGIDYNGFAGIWYLAEGSPCIDAGDPDPSYNDPEDPENPGYALFPAMGTLRNDMGAFGGGNTEYWTDTDSETVQISVYDLFKLYPNPFNPSLTIELDPREVRLNEAVTVRIFNLKGQLIKTLADNEQVKNGVLRWNGRDMSQNEVSSGVYFVKVETADNFNVKRAMLIK